MELKLFLDLDGVFADFDRHFYTLTGKWPHEVEKKRLWAIINNAHTFFYDLPLMQDADRLWDYAKQFNPTFLTGAPSRPEFREQKKRWVAEKFGPEWEVVVLPKRQKPDYSGPLRVLIDDTHSLIEAWNGKGGYGIHHVGDVDETIAKLDEYVTALRG